MQVERHWITAYPPRILRQHGDWSHLFLCNLQVITGLNNKKLETFYCLSICRDFSRASGGYVC